jgi:hypothetical protein
MKIHDKEGLEMQLLNTFKNSWESGVMVAVLVLTVICLFIAPIH